jgi:hypothetical protein
VQLEFSPAFSLRAKLLAADVSGRKVSPKISVNENDQHFSVSAPLNDGRAKITIHLRVSSDFAIGGPYAAPADGATSSALKFVSERWNAAHDKLQLQVAGVSGKTYEVPILKAPSGIEVSGARITKTASGLALQITVPTGTAGAFSTQTVTLQFPAR